LQASRLEIEAYCQDYELTPVFDESNEDISFFRNRIRRELLPLLTDYNAGIRSHLQQLAALSAADVALLDELVAETWARVVLSVDESSVVVDRLAWAELPLSLRRGILRQAVAATWPFEKRPFIQDITFSVIEQARLGAERNETGQRFNLPGDLWLLVDYDRLIVTDDEEIVLDDWPQMAGGQAVKLPVPGELELGGGWKIEAKLVDTVDISEIQTAADNWQVCIAIPSGQDLFVRTREPGERFQPLGMNGRSAKLKEVMVNRKIGASWRKKWPIVANDTHLVWLVGYAIDQRVKITPETEAIIKLLCYRG
jgi:tRNA(Ile)-lysidine synthase